MRRRCPTPRIPILIVFAGALILAGCNRQKSEFLMIRADHGVLPRSAYPTAVDPARVGTYDPLSSSGAGYFYDDVLEYRVWVHPDKDGLPLNGDKDYFFAFAQYDPQQFLLGGRAAAKIRLSLFVRGSGSTSQSLATTSPNTLKE